jgi:hypothetical protein
MQCTKYALRVYNVQKRTREKEHKYVSKFDKKKMKILNRLSGALKVKTKKICK